MDFKVSEEYSTLKNKYTQKLCNYQFETAEEAHRMGIAHPVLRTREEFTALETPYTMRQKTRPVSETRKSTEAWVEESSSSGESFDANAPPCYDDIVLQIELFHKGKQIIEGTELKLLRNEKYGLVGRNGIGKTTFLKALNKRRFGLPRNLAVHAIKQDYVSDERVIDFVGADAGRVLAGLGFTAERQQATLRELSGGWRMRAQLAKAIHIASDLLLLDEPTNFLDVAAIAFLQKAVTTMKTVIIVSHDRHFLNATTTRTLHLNEMRIDEYRGNYASFAMQREAKITAQTKAYVQQQAERAHLQSFVDRFRYSAARSQLAQSKIKILEKMEILTPPRVEPVIKFQFNSTPIHGTLVEFEHATFGYTGGTNIFKDLSLRITSGARIVIVGENGQGKSTLFKMVAGLLKAGKGCTHFHPALRVGYFAQHHVDHLPLGQHALSHLMQTHREDEARQALAAFGLPIANQLIGTLSGGQKSRLAFAILSLQMPNLLLLDEPTNHLDMETIDALATAVASFKGAVVCVSHDFAFIEKAFDTIYVCGDGKLEKFNGSIDDYKAYIKI